MKKDSSLKEAEQVKKYEKVKYIDYDVVSRI